MRTKLPIVSGLNALSASVPKLDVGAETKEWFIAPGVEASENHDHFVSMHIIATGFSLPLRYQWAWIGPRSQQRGAPFTYVTTAEFLAAFDMQSLRDLPSQEDAVV